MFLHSHHVIWDICHTLALILKYPLQTIHLPDLNHYWVFPFISSLSNFWLTRNFFIWKVNRNWWEPRLDCKVDDWIVPNTVIIVFGMWLHSSYTNFSVEVNSPHFLFYITCHNFFSVSHFQCCSPLSHHISTHCK